jgi:hypothetical protein
LTRRLSKEWFIITAILSFLSRAKMSQSLTTPARLIIVGILLSWLPPAFAQVEGMQNFANRVEGRNVHPNALQDFTLIAIHRDFQLFKQDSALRVRFFIPRSAANADRKVFVEAVELQDSFHYFMQAKTSSTWKDGNWNVFEPWPTKDVIDRLGLLAENLGVLAGYRAGNDRPVYLPVDVYVNEGRTAVPTYTFHFITGQDLQSLDVSVTNAAGVAMNVAKPQLKCKKTYNPNCKLYAAGSAGTFPLDMSSLPAGEYHVKLLGHVPGSLTPTSLDILMYHHP